MTIDKVWCKNCYIELSKTFDKKYGKSNWSFANLGTSVFVKSEQCSYIFYPPVLMIELPLKKKNGEYSKSKKQKGLIFLIFVPFVERK